MPPRSHEVDRNRGRAWALVGPNCGAVAATRHHLLPRTSTPLQEKSPDGDECRGKVDLTSGEENLSAHCSTRNVRPRWRSVGDRHHQKCVFVFDVAHKKAPEIATSGAKEERDVLVAPVSRHDQHDSKLQINLRLFCVNSFQPVICVTALVAR